MCVITRKVVKAKRQSLQNSLLACESWSFSIGFNIYYETKNESLLGAKGAKGAERSGGESKRSDSLALARPVSQPNMQPADQPT